MTSGAYEIDENGRNCFRPSVPRLPRLEDVQDVLEGAVRNIHEFDRLLSERPRDGAIGRLFARLDAVHSSGAEGSTTTFTDLMEFETSARVAPDLDDAASVAACAAAFETETDGDLAAMTLRIHRRLFERSRNLMLATSAGQWKQRVNGTADGDSAGGYFYYTKPASVEAAMKEWHDFTLASDPRVPEIIRQIASHWMFEHIHPVSDGNGRIGRLLVPLTLKMKGATKAACAFFGEAVHEDKQLYIEALKSARVSSDLTAWTRLMLVFLSETTNRNIERIGMLADLEQEWRRVTSGFRSDSQVHKVTQFALTHPAFTVTDAVRQISGTFASINTAVNHLVKAGILTAPADTKRDRIFHAEAVLSVFDRFKAQPSPKVRLR
jgi:Fic family protein